MRTTFFVLMLLASPALALDESQIRSACYTDCDKEWTSNEAYEACTARAADTADGVLNHEFKALQDSIEAAANELDAKADTQLDMLKQAQQKWIAFRDQACSFEDSLAFGSAAAGELASSCACALTYQRINDFDRIRQSVLGR